MSEMSDKVIAEARSWIGTPWHHLARVKGAGVDCAQFLVAVYAAAGLIEDFDTEYYPADWFQHHDEPRFVKMVLSKAERVDVPQPADVVMFKFGRHAAHGVIVIEWPLIVHAYKDEGCVCITNVEGSPIEHRVAGFYRVKGV